MKSFVARIPRIFSRSIFMFIAFVMVATLDVPIMRPARGSGRQGRERSVKIKTFNDQPVEIVAVKVKGAPVDIDRKFTGDSDWLNGMIVTIKNVSDKPVVYVTVSVGAHYDKDGVRKRTSDGRDHIAPVDLMYGVSPHLPGQPSRRFPGTPLMPGQTTDLLFSEIQRDQLYKLLGMEDASTDLPELNLWVDHVAWYGDDKTIWSYGRMLKLDPNNPRHWMPVDDPAPPPSRLNHVSRKPKFELAGNPRS